MLAREHGGSAASLAVLESFRERREIDLGDPCAERGDLAAQLLGPLGGRRLERKRTEALLHLRLDVARAFDLHGDACELQLGAVLATLEPSEARCLLQQRAPLLRLGAEDLLHSALADDRVHPPAEAQIGEQLDEVDPAHCGLVQEVLALAAAVQPAGHRQLRVGKRPVSVRVVEEQLDLAEVLCGAPSASGEQHVVRLLGPELGRGERASRPDDRVRDVRLPRAVRPDDDRDTGLEPDLDGVGERLEAAQLESA